MSVDLYVGPPFGAIGVQLHFRFGWPPVGEGESIATNVAWLNLLENLHRVSGDLDAPSLERLLSRQWLSARQARAFASEWRALTERLAAHPADEVVRLADPDEAHGGVIVCTLEDGSKFIRPSRAELASIIHDTVEQAQQEGHTGFQVNTLRDLFWYQVESVSRVTALCVARRRPLLMG